MPILSNDSSNESLRPRRMASHPKCRVPLLLPAWTMTAASEIRAMVRLRIGKFQRRTGVPVRNWDTKASFSPILR